MRYTPRYKQAREELGWSRAELAGKMGVDTSTLGNWESGKRQLTLDNLILMSEVTGFSVHYLLGIDEPQVDWTKPIDPKVLPTLHTSPVWTAGKGWGLVNSIIGSIMFTDGSSVPFSEMQEQCRAFPPAFAYSLHGVGIPLKRAEVEQRISVWVEAISVDTKLSGELRGWYHNKVKFVENEIGQRFYFDMYGSKWLAFDDCL